MSNIQNEETTSNVPKTFETCIDEVLKNNSLCPY